MLACRPRLPHGLSLSSRLGSLGLLIAPLVLLPFAIGCAPSAGGPTTGSAGTSGTAGTSGSAGTSGTAGTIGAAGTGGTTGASGSSGGSVAGTGGGGQSGTAGRGGTGGGAGTTGAAGASAGTSGTAGVTGTAGSAAGRGGSTAGTGGSAGTGTGGGSGSGGGSSTPVCGGGPPSPAAGGANFPFPQHRGYANCIYPTTCSDADMQMGWAAYKTALIVADGTDGSMRVSRGSQDGNDTVSEGIAYGMLFAVYMNDKTTFDAIWKYEQKHLNTHGLMNWHIASNGSTAGMNSATDADEDMAFALVMADKQWGGYTTTATSLLTTVAMYDFGTDGTIKGGDFYTAVNPSYLAPAFYRVFAAYGDNARWTTILNKSYDILAMVQNSTSGLVPDWSAGPATNTSYGYDATRTPFRVALDVCWSGDTRGKTFSQKIGTFFAGIGATNIVDGYNVNGTATGGNKNSTFVGPAGAAGMASNQAALVAGAYTRVSADAKASGTNYYDRSWALFTVMLMTGNFINFQSP